MASAGPNSPSTGTDVSGIGTVTWSSPGNIVSSNDSKAQATLGVNTSSHYLTATGFGFSIPAGAPILGVTAEIELSASNGVLVYDNSVKIVIGGSVMGTDKARASSTKWPTTDTYITYGGGADLWGATITAADVNASDFGVAISAFGLSSVTARVDHIRITVTYNDIVTVSTERRLPYVINQAISATRALPYGVTGQVSTTRRVPYGVAGQVSTVRQVPYVIRTVIAMERRIPYTVGVLAATVRAIPYVVNQHVSTDRRVPYTVLTIVGTQRALVYQVRTAPSTERRLPYAVSGLVATTRRLLWRTLSGTTFTLTDDFIEQAGALSVAYGQPLKQFAFGGLTVFTTSDEELVAALRLLAQENQGVLIEGLPG